MPKSRNPIIKFDKLQMYFGEPYVINIEGVQGQITIYSPTIGNIVELGEEKFYSTLNIFTTNTTAYRLMLWENDIDWNEISDFQLFMMLYKGIDLEASKLIFKDLDWSKFLMYEKKLPDSEEVEMILYNPEDEIEINEQVYYHISQYLRNVFNIFPEEKITTQKTLKQWYINKDKRELENKKTKEEEQTSILSLISACINHPGFKYNLQQLKKVGVAQFYDSVKRLQVYENTTACLKGMYSGFVDGKKLHAEDYNFFKDI